jgi:Transcriptional regulators
MKHSNEMKTANSTECLSQEIQRHEINQFDLQIIELLQEDGRMPFRDIARAIHAPETTIRYRTKRLIDCGIIKISAFINASKIKHDNVAYIELKVKSAFFDALIDEIVAMKNVSYLSAVTGEYDIMLEYIYQDNEDLLAFINYLKERPEIRDVNSKNILKIYKAQYPARVSQV